MNKHILDTYLCLLTCFLIIFGIILITSDAQALNLTYQGDKRLCITENNGSITCLQKGEVFDYDVNKDYIVELTQKIKEKNFGNLINFLTDNALAFGFTMVLFLIGIWMLYYFIVN